VRGLIHRVAFVTGAGHGIGRAIVHRLSEEGCAVAITDIDLQSAQCVCSELRGRVVAAFHIDITDTTSVRNAVKQVEEQLGPIDILVNNVGWDSAMPFMDTTEEFWQRVIDINLKSVLGCTRYVVEGMIERRRGKIVNISSGAGLEGSKGEAVYSAAKGGVIAFSKAMAKELAFHLINVNVIAPGPTNTPLFKKILKERPQFLEAVIRATPLRRAAEPEEIAAAVAFLASDDASFITGQTLSVSGGLTMS
jgi:2-hydroxycyclohexanecarboxyl-CoA dehydrogenase